MKMKFLNSNSDNPSFWSKVTTVIVPVKKKKACGNSFAHHLRTSSKNESSIFYQDQRGTEE